MGEIVRTEIPQGTLYLLILKTLALRENHGYGIALNIAASSRDAFRIEEGSLYPALQKMLFKGWINGEWRTTENNRRARYYKLTLAGKKELERQIAQFRRTSKAVLRVIDA